MPKCAAGPGPECQSVRQDLALRKKQKELEMVWRGAKSFGDQADIFTGNFPDGAWLPEAGQPALS